MLPAPLPTTTMANKSCVTWTNFTEHMVHVYEEMLATHRYTDCRLIVPDGELLASRTILCMASRFFETIFARTVYMVGSAADVPTVLIPDVKLSSLRCVLQFIYTGEVNLLPYDVAPFVEACSLLQIRGVQYAEDRVVGINFGTSAYCLVREGSTANSDGLEAAANLPQDCTQENVQQQCTAVVAMGTPNDSSSIEYAAEYEANNEPEPEHAQYGPPDGINSLENVSDCNSTPNERLDDVKPRSAEKSDQASYETRLSAAIDAVLNQGVSYRLASERYNIAKTVLWRRTMKMPRPVRSSSPKLGNQRKEAIDALKAGEKLVYVSQRYEIPLSTLHRDKIRLYNKGTLPGMVTLAQRDKGESFRQRLTESVNECVAGRMSLSEAARVYKLPKTTIWRRVRMAQAKNSCSEAKEVERTLEATEHCAESSAEENADHTMDVRQCEPLRVGEEFLSDPNLDISGTDLTDDSIMLFKA
ncbi:uncharacterized protein LOC118509615 [Anopheles stephensi]|uniref:uncharacterized protein LOC118509615 n=1 Tax=Anopheles stephensi TaxID=30069 RepID=UPI001658A469|nr:uncharacterized protein LOC118509615 [Anopheles stephensi]